MIHVKQAVVVHRADVVQHAPVRGAQQGDGCFRKGDAGRVDAVITAEGREVPLLRVEQGLNDTVAAAEGGDDADFVDVHPLLLRQGVQGFGDDLRGEAGDAEEDVAGLGWRTLKVS